VGRVKIGFSSGGWRMSAPRRTESGSPAGNASAAAKAVRFAAGAALITLAVPPPAAGQYFPPPLIVVPPPTQDYGAPRLAPKPPPPDNPKPSNPLPPPDGVKGHYQGRTFIPD